MLLPAKQPKPYRHSLSFEVALETTKKRYAGDLIIGVEEPEKMPIQATHISDSLPGNKTRNTCHYHQIWVFTEKNIKRIQGN